MEKDILSKKNKRNVGTYFENMAADYLTDRGIMILERNYRNKLGEIDLIGLDEQGWLIFAEVKYRSSEYSGNPLAAVDRRKQRIISRVALAYLKSRYRSLDVKCRFDVIGIEGEEITWIKNAFDFSNTL